MAIKIGLGLGTEKDALQATQSALREAKQNFKSDKISLAIVFSTIDFVHSSALKTISGSLGSVNIVGASGLGIISNQGIFKHGIAIMLLGLPEGTYVNTGYVKGLGLRQAALAGEELGEKLLYGLKNLRRDLSVLFSDGLLQDETGFLSGLQERLGRSFPLAGGAASDNLQFKKTYIYYNGEALSDAACGMLFGGRLNFGIGIKHGWKPLGKPRQITRSERNTVYEIDGLPAAKLYEDYLAFDLKRLKSELKRISILYPVGVLLAGEDEYLLRNTLTVEDNGALVFQGDVPEGSRIRLMIGTKDSCLGATRQAADEMNKGLYNKPCSFALVFDSVSRYIVLGRQANKELEIINERLGEHTPLIGLYTYGEQAPLKSIGYQGKAYFHDQTITILGIAA